MVSTTKAEQVIANWEWRYATKKFDATKKVNEADIELIKRGIQLAPTSYGVQPFKVLDIQDTELRKKLQPIAWNQGQVVDASHLFVFVYKTETDRDFVESYTKIKAEAVGKTTEELQGYTDFVATKMKEKSSKELASWAEKQSYIALSHAMTTAAALEIDTCPMEGFEADPLNEALGLGKDWKVAALLTLGYRSQEDQSANYPKTRRTQEQLFATL